MMSIGLAIIIMCIGYESIDAKSEVSKGTVFFTVLGLALMAISTLIFMFKYFP